MKVQIWFLSLFVAALFWPTWCFLAFHHMFLLEDAPMFQTVSSAEIIRAQGIAAGTTNHKLTAWKRASSSSPTASPFSVFVRGKHFCLCVWQLLSRLMIEHQNKIRMSGHFYRELDLFLLRSGIKKYKFLTFSRCRMIENDSISVKMSAWQGALKQWVVANHLTVLLLSYSCEEDRPRLNQELGGGEGAARGLLLLF